MKADDFRSFTVDELDKRIADLKKQLFQHRMDLHSNQLQNSNKIKNTKRDIARAMTVRNQMMSEVGGQS